MGFLGLTLLLAQAAGADHADFYQDFRGKEADPEVFRQVGPSAEKLVKTEPEGLRITLASEGITKAVGVAYVVPLEGDFEVTAGYELVHLEQPKGGFGAGFSVYLTTAAPTQEALEFFHLMRPSGAEAYGYSALMTLPGGRRGQIPGAVSADLPVQGKSGRLRVTRVGPEVSLSAAEGDGDFQSLYHFNFGTANVNMVRLAAHPGNAPNPLDLRVVEFWIRQKSIALPAEDPTPSRSSLWLFLLLVLFLLLLSMLLIWFYRRRARKDSSVIVPNQ